MAGCGTRHNVLRRSGALTTTNIDDDDGAAAAAAGAALCNDDGAEVHRKLEVRHKMGEECTARVSVGRLGVALICAAAAVAAGR